MDEAYRDDLCSCGAQLPDTVIPDSWNDYGFCSMRCAIRHGGGIRLQGKAAIEMATYGGRYGGPGFETDLVRDWLKAGTKNAPPSLARISAEADMICGSRESWAWRLFAGGECRFFRLTAKSAAATIQAR